MNLGVNIDHIATLRQARGTTYPSIIEAALKAEKAGADSITLHLREDRRHMQDEDLYELKPLIQTKMNLELAPTEEMIKIALDVKPEDVCIVPERREERTTEGGLDIIRAIAMGANFVMLGRAFHYALAALGQKGFDQMAFMLSDDIKTNMYQMGIKNLSQASERLIK